MFTEQANPYIRIRSIPAGSALRGINVVLLFVFVFNAVFIPWGTFGLKVAALGALLILNLSVFLTADSPDEKLILFFGLALTAFVIVLSALLTGEIILNIRLGYSGFMLLLYTIAKHHRIDLEKLIHGMIFVLAVFVVVNVILHVLGMLDVLENPVLKWLLKTTNFSVKKGAKADFGIAISPKSGPLLAISISYLISKRKFALAAIPVAAMMLTGTRANLIIAILLVLGCLVFVSQNRVVRWFTGIFLGLCVIAVLLEGQVWQYFTGVFLREAGSDAIRAGLLREVLDVWRENPLRFLTGSGFSGTIHSTVRRGAYIYSLEISYWNLLRQVGLIPFILMMTMYLYPVVRLIKRGMVTISLGFIAYLIIAYTNPYLYSTTGLLGLLFMYYVCFDREGYIPERENSVRNLENKYLKTQA
ncbi:MAG: hypothetical protein ACOX75_00055 [Lachnospiraceae bacterium]